VLGEVLPKCRCSCGSGKKVLQRQWVNSAAVPARNPSDRYVSLHFKTQRFLTRPSLKSTIETERRLVSPVLLDALPFPHWRWHCVGGALCGLPRLLFCWHCVFLFSC
jgi:hypothetical protein